MSMDRFQVANAGVNEIGDYLVPKVKNGKLEKPTTATLDVNLLGPIYSKDDPINPRDTDFICGFPSCAPSYPFPGT